MLLGQSVFMDRVTAAGMAIGCCLMHGCHDGKAAHYPEVRAAAWHADFTHKTFLHQLLKAETAERVVGSIAYQLTTAQFPAHLDLAGIVFDQTRVDEGLLRDCTPAPF